MLGEDVLLNVEDGVATVTLNQPDKLNALSDGIKGGIEEALDEIDGRDDVRCVVFEGTDDAFCAGGDVSSMGGGNASDHDNVQRLVDTGERISIRIFNLPVPTVAKIDGYCMGAGVGLAMACDVLVASGRATFSLAFRNVGLSLDFATSIFVTRAVGPYVAKELAYTGEMVPAEDAEEMGLINHAYPDEEFDERAEDLVERIADGPTVALNYSARCIDRAHNSSLREAIEREATAQNVARSTFDHEEGVEEVGEARDPAFEGR
jgi:enoyl-CoA hydratase/carnithine racemase